MSDLYNRDLEEEVYMDIPLGFEDSTTRGKLCRLRMSLYSLKQSHRGLFDRFSQAIIIYGLIQSQVDHTLFIKLITGEGNCYDCLC